MELRALIVKFKNELKPEEVVWFRGAVIHSLAQDNVLFHNHQEERLRYSYPLIQYKRIKGCAAIVCIGEGVEAIGNFFANYQRTLHIGQREVTMEIDYVRPTLYNVQLWDSVFTYHLNRWLPLNAENYKQYQQLEAPDEQKSFLQRMLVGNILSFAKGVGLHVETPLSCKIVDISDSYLIRNKDIKMAAFNVVFSTNISLPAYIGLGKNASINCGIVTKYYPKSEDAEN